MSPSPTVLSSAPCSISPAPGTVTPSFTQRKTAWLPVWLVLTANIYWLFWLYRTYREIRAHSATATTITPARAMGFFFIPLFNIYWLFRVLYDFPRALARVESECAPAGEALPSGSITGMMIAGFLLNILGGFDSRMLLGGEILFATALIVCQRTMNAHTHPLHALVVSPGRSLAELIGATAPTWDWKRPAAFAFAFAAFVAVSPRSLLPWLALGGHVTVNWRSAVDTAALAILAAVGAAIAFRYIRNQWLAALGGAAIFAAGNLAIFLLRWGEFKMLDPTGGLRLWWFQYGSVWPAYLIAIVAEFVCTFVLFAGIAFFARSMQSIWAAAFLAVTYAECAGILLTLPNTLALEFPVLNGLRTFVPWIGRYRSFVAWISWPVGAPHSAVLVGVWEAILQPVIMLQTALLFALALWAAHKFWIEPFALQRRPV